MIDPSATTGGRDARLLEIEQTAVEFARLAGAEIQSSLGRILAVRYKGEDAAGPAPKDPVSEVDHRVEMLIRARLAERFPEHAVIGEEVATSPVAEHEIVWAIDPVDGTANFVNGFPLFAASIGVIAHGRPLVGAVWCSTTHALRPGVYHARAGGRLRFEEEPIEPYRNPGVRRFLAGEPDVPAMDEAPWEMRKSGSAALECALVAAGALRVARFARPNLWDVAGGIQLVLSAGGMVQMGGEGGWSPFERFTAPEEGLAALRRWRRPLVLGDAAAVGAMTRHREAAAPR